MYSEMAGFTTETVSGLENKDFKVVLSKPRKAPPTMPAKPFLGVVVASRGAGKTNSVLSLVKHYAPYHFWDKIVLISPSFENDPKYKLFHDERYDLEVHTEVSESILNDIIERIKGDIDEYKDYEVHAKLWNRMLKAKSVEKFLDRLSPEELVLLETNDFQPPETKWKHGMPTTLLLLDDLTGNKAVYRADSKGILNNFCIRHRHYLTSLLFISQIWKNSVPRQLRNNLSLLMLFKNKSTPIKKEIAEEFSSFIEPERFMDLWDFACQDRHDFLMVDMDSREHMFRRNFNTIIHV